MSDKAYMECVGCSGEMLRQAPGVSWCPSCGTVQLGMSPAKKPLLASRPQPPSFAEAAKMARDVNLSEHDAAMQSAVAVELVRAAAAAEYQTKDQLVEGILGAAIMTHRFMEQVNECRQQS